MSRFHHYLVVLPAGILFLAAPPARAQPQYQVTEIGPFGRPGRRAAGRYIRRDPPGGGHDSAAAARRSDIRNSRKRIDRHGGNK